MKTKSNFLYKIVVVLPALLLMIAIGNSPAKANVFKKALKKVEVAGGWDRYIHSWGDTFIPDPERWVAIRSTMKKKKHMGNFWDIPGSKKQVIGAKKKLQLWELKNKFQTSLERDRKFRFIPAWEVNAKSEADFGYYYILSNTNYFVQSSHPTAKGKQIWLNGYGTDKKFPSDQTYHWKIENVGKNKFVISNRKSNLAIEAKDGKGTKQGIQLVLNTLMNKPHQQWEFILVAQGKEVKSTGKMIKNRAREIGKATKKFTDTGFKEIEKFFTSTVLKGVNNAVQNLAKGLLQVKHDKKSKTLLLSVGVDNPMDKLRQLKDKAIGRFVQIELKRFKFEPVGNDKFRLSLVNKLGTMGKKIELTLSIGMKWKLDQKGFNLHSFTMDRFAIPFLPDKTTKGMRTSVNKSLKKLTVKLKNYPGKAAVAKAVQKIKNPKIKVVKVEKAKTKFLVKLKYAG